MNHSVIKKLIALLLCLLTIASVTTFAITASAASYGSDYWNHTEPSGSDYAYWNGKKMVKHKGTTADNIAWIQTMFNWFIDRGYISCAKLQIDKNYGPKCKSVCQAWQRRAGISVDGSCGPQTIAKMKAERDRIINSQKATEKQSNESGVLYTYYTVTLDTSSMANWINSVKKAENDITNKGKGILVAHKVLSKKQVTWSVPRETVYQGPGLTGMVSQRYTVPVKVQYKLHKHQKNTGYGASWYFTSHSIVTVYTCNCGYRREICEWEIPLPDFTETSDTITTKDIIAKLPQIN